MYFSAEMKIYLKPHTLYIKPTKEDCWVNTINSAGIGFLRGVYTLGINKTVT